MACQCAGQWWVLALAGVGFAVISLFVNDITLATVIGAAAFSCFWGIHEILSQEMRVIRGWFPENPNLSPYFFPTSTADPERAIQVASHMVIKRPLSVGMSSTSS